MPRTLDTFTMVLLGTLAGLTLIQALLLAGAAWQAFRAVHRTEGLAERVGRELRPSLIELSHAAREAAELSDVVAAQTRRLDGILADAVHKVERAQSALQRVLPAAGRLAAAAAAVRLIRSGIRTYRRFRR